MLWVAGLNLEPYVDDPILELTGLHLEVFEEDKRLSSCGGSFGSTTLRLKVC